MSKAEELTKHEIDEALDEAILICEEICFQDNFAPDALSYGVWFECSRALIEAGWTEQQLVSDLKWIFQDQQRKDA